MAVKAFTVKKCLRAPGRRHLYLKRLRLPILLLWLLVATQMAAFLRNYLRAWYGPASKIQEIPICECSRPFAYSPTHYSFTDTVTFKSTCSDEGTFYTQGQNVVAMSLHVIPRKNRLAEFTKGIYLNLEAMRKHYPGYTMRVYTDYTPEGPQDPICKARCKNPDLFWCDIRKTPLLGDLSSSLYFMIWRFLALGDPTVDVLLSRDLDSVITARESAAVKDWLQHKEKKGIQLMRDKFDAHEAEILGGMWGAKNSWLENVTQLQKQIVQTGQWFPEFKGIDQVLLLQEIYRPRKQDIVAYDSYFCMLFRETIHRPFPTQRKMINDSLTSDFVGNVDFGTVTYEFRKCPLECRPSYGKDWEYC